MSDIAVKNKIKSSTYSTPLATLVDSYIRYYAYSNSHTSRAKRLDLKHFIDFLSLQKNYVKPTKLRISDWTESTTLQFMKKLLAQGEAPSTVARRLATLKHMARIFADKLSGFANPTASIKTPQIERTRPKRILLKELKRIRSKAKLRSQEKHSFNRTRNIALFEFMINTGLRAEEVKLLRLGQIDGKLEWVRDVHVGARRYRNVYINDSTRIALKKYLQQRKQMLKIFFKNPGKKSLPLFISTYGADSSNPNSFYMGAKTIWRAINELSVHTPLHPRLLRHYFALGLLKSTRNVNEVAQALGHTNTRITKRYQKQPQRRKKQSA